MPFKSRILIAFLAFTVLTGFGLFKGKLTPEEERANIMEMRAQVLEKLYEEAPSAKSHVENGAGYAVFSNLGVNVLVLSTGNGYGVVHDNATGKDTYMKMYSAGVGLGYGVKDFRAVFIFLTPEAMDRFVNSGWQATAQTDAAAVTSDKGDAIDYEIELAPDVRLYQMTENGLALQATLQGTKYVLDKDLN